MVRPVGGSNLMGRLAASLLRGNIYTQIHQIPPAVKFCFKNTLKPVRITGEFWAKSTQGDDDWRNDEERFISILSPETPRFNIA